MPTCRSHLLGGEYLFSTFAVITGNFKDFLLKNSVKKSTLKAYRSAIIDEFMEWLGETEYVVRIAEDLDDLLCESMHEFYETNPSRGHRMEYGHAIGSLELWFSSWKRHVIKFDRALKGWDNIVPPSKRAPISLVWAFPISYAVFLRGSHVMAVATLLAFECELRREDFCGRLKLEVVLRG